MKRVIVAPAALAGAPLAELKEWLAIRAGHEDAPLEAGLRAALEMCEGFTGIMPLTQICEEVLPAARQWLALSAAPVASLVEVAELSLPDARRGLEERDFTFAIDADGTARLRLNRRIAGERIVVRYRAGLAEGWDTLDAGLRQGIVRLAAHYHLERGAEQAASPPASVAALWRPWRRLRLA